MVNTHAQHYDELKKTIYVCPRLLELELQPFEPRKLPAKYGIFNKYVGLTLCKSFCTNLRVYIKSFYDYYVNTTYEEAQKGYLRVSTSNRTGAIATESHKTPPKMGEADQQCRFYAMYVVLNIFLRRYSYFLWSKHTHNIMKS